MIFQTIKNMTDETLKIIKNSTIIKNFPLEMCFFDPMTLNNTYKFFENININQLITDNRFEVFIMFFCLFNTLCMFMLLFKMNICKYYLLAIYEKKYKKQKNMIYNTNDPIISSKNGSDLIKKSIINLIKQKGNLSQASIGRILKLDLPSEEGGRHRSWVAHYFCSQLLLEKRLNRDTVTKYYYIN